MSSKKSKKKELESLLENENSINICDSMRFTTAEAYKMLRTKLNLIAPRSVVSEGDKQHNCRIIGITSALRGEGKSTTAINLAYTIAEANHNVCLIEADMRLPNLARRLSLEKTPGLSNLLTGQVTVQNTLQTYVSEKGVKIYTITAGDIPPTPSELLESANMEALLEAFSKTFDYIIIDLPPITVVTDPLSISELLDGMLLVVRNKYCDKRFLRDAMDQLHLANTKILGVVFTCAEGTAMGGVHTSTYRRKYKYGYRYHSDSRSIR